MSRLIRTQEFLHRVTLMDTLAEAVKTNYGVVEIENILDLHTLSCLAYIVTRLL
jgi:hypothetical protein